MRKSTFSPLYEAVRAELVAMREGAGLTQRELAAKLGREHSFVGRIELGERRLDLVEFFWVCRACGCDPVETADRLMRQFVSSGSSESHAQPRPTRRRR
jgi:transcriptional regulator with XRE-family HTH domain